MDTIAAISTPMGEGAIAIIRLSGPDAVQIADRMYKGPKEKKACIGGFTYHSLWPYRGF